MVQRIEKRIHRDKDGSEFEYQVVVSPIAEGQATWRCSLTEQGNLWYLRLSERRYPPYVKQIHVEAIVDIADDGTVAGIEIIDEKMLGPPKTAKHTFMGEPWIDASEMGP
jgi:hypothetical protein